MRLTVPFDLAKVRITVPSGRVVWRMLSSAGPPGGPDTPMASVHTQRMCAEQAQRLRTACFVQPGFAVRQRPLDRALCCSRRLQRERSQSRSSCTPRASVQDNKAGSPMDYGPKVDGKCTYCMDEKEVECPVCTLGEIFAAHGCCVSVTLWLESSRGGNASSRALSFFESLH